MALADAAILAWDAKYAYETWRPITAIQQAGTDGNDSTSADPAWQSLLITPPFPEYVSGHSTFSGAAAEILTALLGDNVAFTTSSFGLPGVQRSFTNFQQAAEEAGRSRIYGGIHFQFANEDGLNAGRELAQHVLERFAVETDALPPQIVFTQQPDDGVAGSTAVFEGWVIDNLSGVSALEVYVDDPEDIGFPEDDEAGSIPGRRIVVPVDPLGRFHLPLDFAADGSEDGFHAVTFVARDFAGNIGERYLVSLLVDTTAPTVTVFSPQPNDVLGPGNILDAFVDGTGSPIVSATYQIDNGTPMPAAFNSQTGRLSQPFDLSDIQPGTHTLLVSVQDGIGLSSSTTISFQFAASPLTIARHAPLDGAVDVGTTFRPQVFFSRPIDISTLSNSNLYLTDTTGAKLPAAIVPALDGRAAWLFPAAPMPGSSMITAHLDGSTILDGDGSALDADGDGTPGGVLRYRFSTVSLSPLLGTTLTGRIVDPGPDLKPMTFDDIRVGADGILHTADDVFLNPIAHARVFILGLEDQAVYTDANGNFSFSMVPSGTIKLAIDGRTATNPPSASFWPEMVMDLEIEAGRANTVMGTMGTREENVANLERPEVYLPRLRTDILQPISGTSVTVVGVSPESAPNLTEAWRSARKAGSAARECDRGERSTAHDRGGWHQHRATGTCS